mmetsp:Transcript_123921/g.246694  ORF Transcript_123921/g.246694 Transcript_123921/m.246694 type:complete len:232 (-) Transcript_123921:289-984(-)
MLEESKPRLSCNCLYLLAFIFCFSLNASRVAAAQIVFEPASAPAETLAMRASLSAFITAMDCTTCWTCCSYSLTTLCCSEIWIAVIVFSKLGGKSILRISNLVATTLPFCHMVSFIWRSISKAIWSRFFQKSCGVYCCAVLLIMFPARRRCLCLATSYCPRFRYRSWIFDGTYWICKAQVMEICWPPLSGSLASAAPVRVMTGGRSSDLLENSSVVWAAGYFMTLQRGPGK